MCSSWPSKELHVLHLDIECSIMPFKRILYKLKCSVFVMPFKRSVSPSRLVDVILSNSLKEKYMLYQIHYAHLSYLTYKSTYPTREKRLDPSKLDIFALVGS